MKSTATIIVCGLALASTASTHPTSFIPGETAEYKVSWMGIPLAWSTTSIDATNGLIRIRQVSQTYKAYTHIYQVDDATEVMVDPATSLPVSLDFKLNEGSIRKSHFTRFDHANKQAVFIDRISNTTNTVAIHENTRDILTFLYSVRNQPLQSLANEIHELYVEGKIYELGLELHRTKGLHLPEYGKVECTEIEPLAEFDGLFLRQGKIFFWVSKQNRRMVTCIEAKVPVGKINVKLQSVSGPGDDFWVRSE
ncbi:DUF3108 domain-containing protein [Pontiella sp.]|uniref:DUF3108 domain-containing protein n=1 Tax=Pontiella sp. TaxID=2837462 RepID=UPI003569A8ED